MHSFIDGKNIDTGGELRTLRLKDGLYVVGEGYLIPVASAAQAEGAIDEIESLLAEEKARREMEARRALGL
jgi:hypothetical protein